MKQVNITASYPVNPEPDVIQATVHYLMTKYMLKPCRGLALGVVNHITLLLNHPDFNPVGVHANAYQDLLQSWKEINIQKNQRGYTEAHEANHHEKKYLH